MSKFTKGEWKTFIGCTGVTAIISNDITVVSWQGFDDLDIPKLEKKANAHLIASAPDMYKFIQSLQLSVSDDVRRDLILAKARGEL